MSPHIEQMNTILSPGLSVLRWTSLNLTDFVNTVQKHLKDLEQRIDSVIGIHEHRIFKTFSEMLKVPLCDVPSQDVITVEEFTAKTEELCQNGAICLENKSLVVEKAVQELLDLLLLADDSLPSEPPEDTTVPGALTLKRKHEQQSKMQQEAEVLYDYYQQTNIDTLVQLFRNSMETLRKRVAFASALGYTEFSADEKKEHHPLFVADIILSLPNLVMKPSLDEIQQTMNHIVQTILSILKNIYCWGQVRPGSHTQSVIGLHSRMKLDTSTTRLKTYYHVVAEHKEIVKLMVVLSTSLSSTKTVIQSNIDQYARYKLLWAVDRDEQVAKFSETNPSVSDYQQEMHMFQQLEESIQSESDTQAAGAVCLHTEKLKVMLITEAKQWRVCYGRSMSQHYQAIMDEIFLSIEEWIKLISRPLKDLDDIRSVMATLKEIRENEIRIDMFLGPIEVMLL